MPRGGGDAVSMEVEAVTHLLVTCDGCGASSRYDGKTEAEAQRAAEAEGWLIEGARDLCASCRRFAAPKRGASSEPSSGCSSDPSPTE